MGFCECGAPHPSVDVHLIFQIIRCSERYYEPEKFHGRGEYGAHLTYTLYAGTYIILCTYACLAAQCVLIHVKYNIMHTYVLYVLTYILVHRTVYRYTHIHEISYTIYLFAVVCSYVHIIICMY